MKRVIEVVKYVGALVAFAILTGGPLLVALYLY